MRNARLAARLKARARLTRLENGFDGLRNVLPTYQSGRKKLSKIETLKLAKMYIADLGALLHSTERRSTEKVDLSQSGTLTSTSFERPTIETTDAAAVLSAGALCADASWACVLTDVSSKPSSAAKLRDEHLRWHPQPSYEQDFSLARSSNWTCYGSTSDLSTLSRTSSPDCCAVRKLAILSSSLLSNKL